MKQNPSTTIFRSFRMGSLWENPMLRGLLGLSPAVLICTSLKQGLILGAFTLCVFLPTALLTYFFFRRLPFWARIPVYVLCSTLILSPLSLAAELWFPSVMAEIGLFSPLIIVNSAQFLMLETLARGSIARRCALPEAAGMMTGYLLVLLLLSALRELGSSGSLFDIPVTKKAYVPAAGSPFAALILLGLLAALLQWTRNRFHREEAAE